MFPGSVSIQDVHGAYWTIIREMRDSVCVGHDLISDVIRILKKGIHHPDISLKPFMLGLALSLTELTAYREQVILKKNSWFSFQASLILILTPFRF